MSDFTIGFARDTQRAGRRFGGRASLGRTVFAGLAAMFRARQTRRMLAVMDDRLLADIGIGRGEALTEAARPMWDVRTSGR